MAVLALEAVTCVSDFLTLPPCSQCEADFLKGDFAMSLYDRVNRRTYIIHDRCEISFAARMNDSS